MPGKTNPGLQVFVGDITRLNADVIVNSAHESLAPGGGVSGAIHKAAGPDLAADCAEIVRLHGWLEAGQAVITKAYAMNAKYVVHAVAPRYSDLGPSCHVQLSEAYLRSIELAIQVGAKSIAFPSLGTGIFGFPIETAPVYALKGIRAGLQAGSSIESVTMCFFSELDAQSFQKLAMSDNFELL